jgi:hypothetical protein
VLATVSSFFILRRTFHKIKTVDSTEQKAFLTESCSRNGRKVSDECNIFCEWFLNTLHYNDATLNTFFFTDEAWFCETGCVNSQNMRTWSAENPHLYLSPLYST